MTIKKTRRALLATLARFGLVMAASPALANSRMPADEAPPSPLSSADMIGKRLRVIRPNQAVTMDYSEDRVNVTVDDQGKITRVHIG